MNRWRSIRTTCVLVPALLVVTACNTTSGGDEEGAGATTTDGAPVSAQELRVATSVAPVSLDPHGDQSAEEGLQAIVQHIFDPLVHLTSDGEFEPVLAESWTNPDEHTWEFTLRSDATFHDGTPVTAEDVRASAGRLIELEGPLSPLWSSVTDIEATDDHTVTFRTAEPLGTMLGAVSLLFVIPADEADQETFTSEPIGSGPFLFQEFVPDERVVLTRNEDYWDGAPALDRLEFVWIPEVSGRLTALETGEVDIATGIDPDQVAEVQAIDGVEFGSTASFTYYFNWFNASREPFDDQRVRQAMWHAIDVEAVTGDLFADMAEVARAPIPQDVFGAPQLEPYSHDPDLAREMLSDAGYPDGFSVSLQWPRGSGTNIDALAETLISQWAAIGVTVEPLPKERAQWIDDLNALQWDMNLQTNSVKTGDADYTLGRLYTCEAGRNGYCNDDLDALLQAGRTTIDEDQRLEIYREASEIIWNDAVGIFPMDLKVNAAWRDHVQGFAPGPEGRPRFHETSVSG